MVKRGMRKASLFHGRARSQRSIVYGGQVWAFTVLSLFLAALTSPLWLVSPPEFLGSKQEFRYVGGAFWLSIAVLGVFAGRSWGLRVALDDDGHIVSREQCTPWRVKTLWSQPGDRISYVSLSNNPEGIARLEAWLKDGSRLLIEKGANAADLGTLGERVAKCWGVPYRIPSGPETPGEPA